MAVLRRGLIVQANSALVRGLGFERLAPLFDTPLLDRLVPADRIKAAEHIDAAETGNDRLLLPPVVVRIAVPDGGVRWMEWSAQALESPEVVVCLHPIDELRALQRALEESESLASLGALAIGVAHELTNPLSFVMANLQWLDEDLPRDDPSAWDRLRRVQDALSGARQVSRVVEDLRAYAQADLEAVRTVRVDRVLDTALGLALHRVRHQASVHWERTEGDLVALAAEGRVVRLLVDLLLTAVRSFAVDDPQHNQIFMRSGEGSAGPWVEVECRSDRGVGLDPVASEDALLVRGARALGGELTSRNLVEGHRLVRLWLPPCPRPRTKPQITELRPSPREVKERLKVLLVDDEELIGRALSLGLERECDVTAVSSGDEPGPAGPGRSVRRGPARRGDAAPGRTGDLGPHPRATQRPGGPGRVHHGWCHHGDSPQAPAGHRGRGDAQAHRPGQAQAPGEAGGCARGVSATRDPRPAVAYRNRIGT